jgi:hypothetical protein
MQFPLYSRRRAAPTASFAQTPQISLTGWLQRRMPDGITTGGTGAQEDPEESEGLLRHEAMQYMRYQRRWNACIFISMLCTAVFASLAFAGLGYTLLRVNMGMTSIQADVQPHVNEISAAALSAINDASSTLHHVHGTTESTHLVADVGAPQILSSINSTTKIMSNLEKLLSHPAIKISLED